ncbi:MAG: SH3 domain-containing protein [Clostridia bacterium]|nr:SH3 domain-containing protein [Clostridia bacterium]
MKTAFGKKKWIVAALTLLLCLLMTTVALAAEFGVVSGTSSLNLRSAGSSSSQWKGAYPRGTWVEIIGSQNNFYQVLTPDGKVGYMSKNYIDATGNYTQKLRIATVHNPNGGAYLNFRAAPSYNAKVLGIFYNGTPLLVLGEQNGWYCVQINGQVGYVRSEYVGVDYLAGSSQVATIKTPNNSAMNLRSGPGKNYSVVRQYAGDVYVMVLAKGDDWWRVSVNGHTGFMSSDFLSEGLKAARDLSATDGGGVSGNCYAVVNNPRATQALNLRQYPTTAAAVLRKLYNGDELWVDEHGSEWCAVTDQETGISGYVMTKYIRLYNVPSTTTRTVVHPSGTYVNLRQGQSLTSNVILRVPHGRQVTILSAGSEWCKVSYNGYQGYMLTYFLK